MEPDILVVLYTYDRYELLKESLETMFKDPGMKFRLWVLDNGSAFSNLYGTPKNHSGKKQANLLMEYYQRGKVETLIYQNRNIGINHACNMLMALAKLHSDVPEIKVPEFVLRTNDDMVYEPNWLSACHETLLACESYPEGKVTIVSPFHCYHSNGSLADKMHTIAHWDAGNGKTYEIKLNVSGNTWFMRGYTWMTTFDWLPVNHPTEGGDWRDLGINNKLGFKCAVTPQEMAHHNAEAVGGGKWNRLGHW